jgi:hypothetical protein
MCVLSAFCILLERIFERRYFCNLFHSTDESTSYNYLSSSSSSAYPNYQQQQQHHHHHYQQQLQSTVPGMHNSNLITSSLSMPHDISSNIYIPSTSSTAAIMQSQSQSSQPLDQQHLMYSDEFAHLDDQEQYIYVQTYPSEMKKRLSDRYDNDLLHVSLSNEPLL